MRIKATIAVGTVLAIFASTALGGGGGPKTRLISKTSGGEPASGGSSETAVTTPSGRYVAFESRGTNLPGANGSSHIYLRDRERQKTKLISRASGGAPANGSSFNPSVSADGQLVAFHSNAPNLPGPTGPPQVYVRDLDRQRTRLVSKTSGGDPGTGLSVDPSISANGRFVAFESAATNLPAPTSGTQVYVRNLQTGRTKLISKTSGGDPAAGGNSSDATISRTGRFVGFESDSPNLPGAAAATGDQAYVRDRKRAKTSLVSRTTADDAAEGHSEDAAVSASGRFVAFESDADNLPGGTISDQVYLRDRLRGRTFLISKTSGGDPGNPGSQDPSVSNDGRFVAFESEATNLGGGGVNDPQVVLRDRLRGKTKLVSKANDGSPANGDSFLAPAARTVSGNGRFVVFHSFATNLPGSLGPIATQVYIRGPLG